MLDSKGHDLSPPHSPALRHHTISRLVFEGELLSGTRVPELAVIARKKTANNCGLCPHKSSVSAGFRCAITAKILADIR